jgi:O-antigen/teichoic acid export membrane protein
VIKKIIPKSSFAKNVITLMTGTTIAQAIPIVITPILTRMYTPEDFGVLALFVAITVILGTVANARYELAITLPESEENAIEIAALGIVISSLFSLFLLIPFVLFNRPLSLLLNESGISFWLYFVPLVVWVVGIFNVLIYLNIRCKKYKDIAKSNVYKSVAMVGVQLFLGVVSAGLAGLILGQIASSVSSVYRLSKNIDTMKLYRNMKKRKRLVYNAMRYKKFLIYMFPASLMNALFGNIVSLAIPSLFEIKTLGFYSLAQRVLGAPMSLIGSSVSQVYAQEASEERNATGKIVSTFNKTLKKLVILSFLFFLPLYFLVEDIFAIAFGEDWRVAGYYAKLLLPYFSLKFVVSSLSLTDSIMEKQYIYAIFNMINLLLVLFLMFFFSDSFVYFIKSFVFSFSITYVLYLLVISFVAKGRF